MNAARPPDEDSRPAFAPSSVQPDLDLDAFEPVVGNKLAVGLRLDEYEISGVLGEGGFGIVYLAWDHSLQRRIAIKEYMPAALAWRAQGMKVQVKSPRAAESFDAGLRSFINEAKLLASFDHPSLVKVHRFWQANGTAYMAMPFYEGITLKEALASSDRPPDERWLRDLLTPLLAALEYMHAASCFHRDIAPDNILLIDEGRPLLLDFGAARRVIGDLTKAVTVILKPGYAPIEQYGDMPGIGQGPWTDLYALGAVLHFAMTGEVPRASVTRLVADDMVPLAQRLAGRYSDRLLRAVDRMLAVRPEGRPQTVGELRRLMGLEPTQESGRIVLAPRMAPGAEPWTRPNTRSQSLPGSLPLSLPLPVPVPQPAARPVAHPAAAPKPMPAVPRRRARPTWAVLGAAALGLAGLLGALWWFTMPAPSPEAADAAREAAQPPANAPGAKPLAEAPAPALASAPVATPPGAMAEPAASAPEMTPGSGQAATAAASAPMGVTPTAPAPTEPAVARPEATEPAVPKARQPVPGPTTAGPADTAPKPRPQASAAARPAVPHRVEHAPVPKAEPVAPTTAPRIPGNTARCADIIQRVSIGETLTAADRRILKEECGK